jgi:hypothetical protein
VDGVGMRLGRKKKDKVCLYVSVDISSIEQTKNITQIRDLIARNDDMWRDEPRLRQFAVMDPKPVNEKGLVRLRTAKTPSAL